MSKLSLAILNEDEIQALHQQTLWVLEHVGCRVASKEFRVALRKAGAKVDDASETARFPAKMVDEMIDLAPDTALHQELSGKVHTSNAESRFYGAILLDPNVVDYHEGRRKPVLEDVRRHTIIAQSLPHVSALMRMQQSITAIPGEAGYLATMETYIRHHNKHLHIMPTDMDNCRLWLELLDMLQDHYGWADRSPVATIAVAVTSPLQLHDINCQLLQTAIDRGFPFTTTVCPMAGATSPYTVAGTALLANVDALLPILIAQVLKPGHPSYYVTAPSVMDMRSGHDLYYKAEKVKFKLIAGQMSRFYQLPASGEFGGSMTYQHDMQNGAESMAYILASVLGGQASMIGLGSLDNANGMSGEQIIIQHAMLEMAEYLRKGVSMDRLEADARSIARAGIGGNFLADEWTLENLRGDEFFDSDLFDFSGGYHKDSEDIYERAHHKADELVENYTHVVPDKTRDAIQAFFDEKRKQRSDSGGTYVQVSQETKEQKAL
ncbi:MAG: trimethylamine methyltransferase family protein [Phycisphaerae bacterium]|nr:trimethylamine methyltransferase family protein [Phycisphaerae bacterium]